MVLIRFLFLGPGNAHVCCALRGKPMTASGVHGIDLFKIAGRSISGWIPSLKTGKEL
jgi:hypothetical protein